ncbi:MAG: hypothetical protein AB1486_00835 [Planctomycetota bacterium]
MRHSILATGTVIAALTCVGSASGQQGERLLERVTPQGTELVREYSTSDTTSIWSPGIAPLGTPPGLDWHYPNPPGQPWISATVAVGQRSTQVIAGQDLNYKRAQLFSVYDGDPPAPIWEDTSLAAPITVYEVDSSQTGDYHVLLYTSDYATSGFTHAVNMYRSGSPVPAWTWTSPFSDTGAVRVAIDRAPTVVAIGVHEMGAGLLHLFFLDPGTGSQIATYSQSTPAGVRGFDLSADGSTLYFHDGATDCYIFDIASQSVIFTAYIGASLDGHAISGDGKKFAFGKFYSIRVYEYVGGTWQYFQYGLGGGRYGDEMDFSDDGTTLGFTATQFSPNYGQTDIYMMDVATQSITAHVVNLSNGVKQDVCTAAAISHDGRYFAAGRWGDAQNANPEVQLLENGVGLIGTIDTRGSVFDADISWDGLVTVASGKAIHANDFGNGGDVYCYHRGGAEMDLAGSPIIGQVIRLDMYTNPNWYFIPLLGIADQPEGWATFPFGTLFLDPTQGLWLLPMVPADPSGLASLSSALPDDPGLVGATVFLQAVSFPFDRSVLQLTNNYVTLTVLP